MIQIIAGKKGTGKTKRIIKMANDEVKVTSGNVVFLDDDKSLMYDLHYNVRFVDMSEYEIENYKIFFGFINGIYSQNSDIKKIYIDGLIRILNDIPIPQQEKLITLFEEFAEKNDVSFVITLSGEKDTFPETISKFFI